ncbi:hypothetical protein [Paraburkholderia sp. J41]|uniref:hypothetical protein n=1 Tax=Paraburkholderia sp. J41 TaxID=2805433 RepID=UPI002AC32E24|nr:hypothetical protein [Paraburkholderia sp. J41]
MAAAAPRYNFARRACAPWVRTHPALCHSFGVRLKRLAHSLCFVLTACAASSAFADCWGSAAFQSCRDASGNTYVVQRYGDASQVPVYTQDAESPSKQLYNTRGSTTFIDGAAADGSTWNETVKNYGNGSRTITGMDGDGLVYNMYCDSFGCR